MLSSSSLVTGRLTEIATIADSYMGLKETNTGLMQRNAELEKEVLRLQSTIERLTVDTLVYNRLIRDSVTRPFPYQYVTAKVVGNILLSKSNFLTINKGSNDGIRADMGVVSSNGVVGVVKAVSPHYAKVIPVINSAFAISCKLRRSEYFGTLTWDGVDYEHTQLTHLPKHVQFNTGDSVYTSGYSSIFPENVYVGRVVAQSSSPDDNFNSLQVALSTDFGNLKMVYVIINYDRDERQAVEEERPLPPQTRDSMNVDSL